MFKIQLQNGEFYKSKSGRVQHYKSSEKAEAKIKKLGDIAAGATVVESKARTSAAKTEITEEIAIGTATASDEFITDAEAAKVTNSKARTAKTENPEEIAPETKVIKVSKTKKAAKAEKPDEFVTDAEAAKETIGKTKKTKKNKKT